MVRSGNAGAFETIVDRYQGRLLGFCRQMLGSTEDAEDVLQEVFVNAYRAMLGDEREINLRPWLYRIARNRCLNHLRKPTADAQESMDMVPIVEAASTAEKVHNREEFRQLLSDVSRLPETQRSALLLREMDAMSYEEIAHAMETSVPSVKSLLVRARISLAEASQARQLTCGEVQLALAEAAEGLAKVSGPVRRHVRDCEECADFRAQVRSNDKVLAALFPAGPLLAIKGFIASKLGLGGASSGAGAGAAGASAGTAATGAVSSVGAAISSGGAAGGIGAVGGALGTKAVAGVVTAAVLTAGAVEVQKQVSPATPAPSPIVRLSGNPATHAPKIAHARPVQPPAQPALQSDPAPKVQPAPQPDAAPSSESTEPPAGSSAGEEAETQSAPSEGSETTAAIGEGDPSTGAGAPAASGGTVVVVVGSTPPAEQVSPPPPPPASEPVEPVTEPAPSEATPPEEP